jgi:PilZ domain
MTRSAATEVAVFDRRNNTRKRVEYAGSIQRTRGRQDLCVIWDVSDKGARLVVPSAKDVPDKFVLMITRKKQERYYCRVMWRTECQVGVAFQEN